jgi:HPt (histidine-containing phosphotransfer) domain-containing protein
MSQDEFADLRARFRERAAVQAAHLRECLANGDLGAPDIERLAHTVAGIGPMLGFGELAATAAAIDDYYANGKAPPREALETLALALEALSKGP